MIRNDNGLYEANFQALIADLELTVGEGYFSTEEFSTQPASWWHGHEVVIWYRGGPAAEDEKYPDTRTWTDAEIDTLINLMQDHNVLLISQNHGYLSKKFYGHGWRDWYGWDEHAITPAVRTGDERLLWALGMTEADGLELDGFSRLMSSPRHLATCGEVSGRFSIDGCDADGLGAAERNTINASGDVPLSLSFGEPRQMVGYGYYSYGQRDTFAPGFVPGINCGEPFLGRYDVAFFSGGCQGAPYGDVGYWPGPYDFSESGVHRVYWIGYPWATTEVLESATGKMVGPEHRYLLLMNILGWLDRGLWMNGSVNSGYSGGSMMIYSGVTNYLEEPEIIQVMAGNWEDGGYNYDTVSYTRTGSNISYPDQTMPDAYVSTDRGGNHVVTASRNNDWINPNDLDFSFPWYAYIVDVNGDGVQTGAGNNIDDTVFFGGLLLEDPGSAWAREMTHDHYGQNGLDPGDNVPSAVIDGFDPPVVVAGYYVSTTGDVGGEIRAGYGTGRASVAIDNAKPVTVECVAHWPLTLDYGGYTTVEGEFVPLSEPRLLWSMYPGHNMQVPEVYGGDGWTRVEDTPGGWDSFRWMFDVDPGVVVPGRAEDSVWNRPGFDFTDSLKDGRVVTFDYRSVPHWNPDLNRDGDDNSLGTADVADKFPVRVRLITEFSDYALWSETWPDHLQDPGIDPAAGGPIWYDDDDHDPPLYYADWPDYIEGGAYIVDTGTPVYD